MAPRVKIPLARTHTCTHMEQRWSSSSCAPFLIHIYRSSLLHQCLVRNHWMYRGWPLRAQILHICLWRVLFIFCLFGRQGSGKVANCHSCGGSCYNGKGKMNHLNPFSQPLLFPWETTETAAFGPLIIHKPVYSFIDTKACCNHCKFKCAKRNGKFKPD